MDSSDFELQKPSHIYDALDGQREQENDDDNAIGVLDDPQYESFAYTGNLNQEVHAHEEDFKFKKIVLPSNDELKHITCSLVPEQMNILRQVIGYCKDVIKSDLNLVSLYNVILRLTKIMNRADENWAHF